MRHAEFTTSIPALAPTAATAPTAPAGNGGGNFGGVFGQLQGEVADFIQNGDGGFSSAANLSAEGSVYRARSSEAAAAKEPAPLGELAADLIVGGDVHRAVFDHRRLGARASHIERDAIGHALPGR